LAVPSNASSSVGVEDIVVVVCCTLDGKIAEVETKERWESVGAKPRWHCKRFA